ncbi:MAG: hypothetical protein V4580_13905 [Bacteroidota bacterium]
MKKFLSITCLAILMIATKAYSQSNLTWTVKDKVQKGFFKTSKVINSNFSGFSSKEEATTFFNKLKTDRSVLSAVVTNTDVKGNSDVVITMRETHDKSFYIGMAQKYQVNYILVNGQKKTPAQIIEDTRNKKKK